MGAPSSIDQYGHGIINFSKTFPQIPTVICTIAGDDYNHELGVFNITTTSFQIYSTAGWPKPSNHNPPNNNGIYYIAICNNPRWTGNLNSLPFQIQFGTITNSSPTEWIGGYIFPNVFQSTPIVVGTASFLEPPNQDCNVTFDSISCNMMHINVSGGWPSNGIQYIAICEYVQPTSSDPPMYMDGNIIPFTSNPSDENPSIITTSSSVNNPTSIITSPNGLCDLSYTRDTSTTVPTAYIDVVNVVNQSFDMWVTNNPLIQSLSFISFANNLASTISKFDLPYIIDFGQFDNNISTFTTTSINIPFNFTFSSSPTVIFSYNNFMDFGFFSGTYIYYYISLITPYYFTVSLNISETIPHTFYWMAILKNPSSSVSSSSLQYPIDFGSYMIDPNNMIANIPYSLQTVNGKENSKIYGMIEFTTSFSKQPVVISGNQLVQIDTITKDYFHINSNFPFQLSPHVESSSYYVSWIAIEFPTTIDNPLFTCPSTMYIDGCPSSIQIAPSVLQPQCNTYTIDYLSITKENSFPDISIYTPASSNPPSPSPALNLPDIVFCNIDVSKGNTTATSSNSICLITYQHLNSSGGDISIDVNTSYGWFSRCSSFGNVFIRITTSYASNDPLTFNFTNVGLNENFQYYVQWGYSQDQIFGPFTTTYTDTFGHSKCSPFNVGCKIEQWFENNCSIVVKPLVSAATSLSGFNKAACASIIGAMGASCTAELGGPEDPVGDGICAVQSTTKIKLCSVLAGATEGYAVSQLCKFA
jgi:hypothetical protein